MGPQWNYFPWCLSCLKKYAPPGAILNPQSEIVRGVDGIRTRDEGFADPCLTTWPRRHLIPYYKMRIADLQSSSERAMGFEPTTFSLARRRSTTEPRPQFGLLPDRECRDTELNCGHRDFQSRALPTELSRPDIPMLSVRDFTRRGGYCQAMMMHPAHASPFS